MNTPGLVSVVMAARNEQQFIAEALESVLAQDYEAVEVIVVDDGSTDQTARVADGFYVRVLRVAHAGPAAARNIGLEAAQGTYWLAFDADDVMPSDRIRRQVAYLEAHPDAGVVFGLAEAFVTPGQSRPAHWNPIWDRGPFPGHPATMLARREVRDLVGPYDPSLHHAEDLDWQARAQEAGIVSGRLDHVCLRYRVHRGNTSSDRLGNRADTFAMLRQGIRRRRDRAAGDAS
ncbi:MAG TPA: glycosyltransferase family A protein [Solirubrobacteraceae bacterium]|nr:glycosyltransferase family A protein [Solirubrobacteraceae bacterium]